MSNYKKYIRVNNDWEELCPDAPHLVLTVTEDYEGNSQSSWSLNGETATMTNSADLIAKAAGSNSPILVDAQYSYVGDTSEDNATWYIENAIVYQRSFSEDSETGGKYLNFSALGYAEGTGWIGNTYADFLGNVTALGLAIVTGYSAEGTDVPPGAFVSYYDAQRFDWKSYGGYMGGIFVDKSAGNYDFYAKKYISATSDSTPTFSTSEGSLVTTIPNVSAPSLGVVQNSGLTGSQLYYESTGFEFSHSILTFDYSWGGTSAYRGGNAWILPIQGDNRQVLAHGSSYRKSVLVVGGHQGYVSMLTSGWDSDSDTGTMAFTTCSLPETGTTFVGKVAQTTESGSTVHRITLGYGQDGLDITPFYTQPSYWKNYQPNVHFRIRLQSTSGLTSAPDITYLRIPYYNGSTATYTDYPIRVNGDSVGTVDIRELGGYYLDVTFSDNSATGFMITSLLPDGDLVDY